MKTAIALLVLATCLAAPACAGDVLTEGPFSGIDLAGLPEKHAAVLRAANEDFVLVVNGRTPRHAVFDKDAPLPADGGTTFYVTYSYKGTKSGLTDTNVGSVTRTIVDAFVSVLYDTNDELQDAYYAGFVESAVDDDLDKRGDADDIDSI